MRTRDLLFVAGGSVSAGALIAIAQFALAGVGTAESASVTKEDRLIELCDSLGSHPDDPDTPADGVPDDALDGAAIVEACTSAIAADPDTPRLHYQLARGLLATGRVDAAIEQLAEAAEGGHGAAFALLGDAMLEGLTGEPDPETARDLYEQAIEAGFEPAEEMLAALGAGAEAPPAEAAAASIAATQPANQYAPPPPTIASPAPARVSFDNYAAPKFLDALYNGNYQSGSVNTWNGVAYAINMADIFRQSCKGVPNAITYDEWNGWQRRAVRELTDYTFSAQGQEQILTNVFTNLMQMTQDPAAYIASNTGGDLPVQEEIRFRAQGDAQLLLAEFGGCESGVAQRFFKNIREVMG